MVKKVSELKSSEKSSTTNVSELVPYRYLMSSIWTFDGIENKHVIYRRKLHEKVLGILKAGHNEEN